MLGSLQNNANSKQLYHLSLDGGECQLFPAHPELSEFIDYYWFLSITASELDLKVIPDTAIDLVMCPGVIEFAALYFPTTKIRHIPLKGPVDYVGVCFRPAAINTLLRSEIVCLRELDVGPQIIDHLGIGILAAAVSENREMPILKNHFDQFWLNQLAGAIDTVKPNPTLSHSDLIEVFEDTLGSESIASVCQSLEISERHFRRLSNELFGLSPKRVQSLLRLQVVLSELFECERQQVHDLYYDDSHRIREIKKLTGLTPRKIREMAEKYNQS